MCKSKLPTLKYMLTLTFLLATLVACSYSPYLPPVSNNGYPCYLPIPPHDEIVQPTPFSKDVTIIENDGRILFIPISESTFEAQVYSSGCFSSSYHFSLSTEATVFPIPTPAPATQTPDPAAYPPPTETPFVDHNYIYP